MTAGIGVPDAALAHHTILLGKTRAGKSSTMRLFVERLLDLEKPVCIIDPKGDWWGLKSSRDGKKAGYKVLIFGGEHADVPINEHSGAAVAELVATGNRPCIIDLGGWMVGARTRFFIAFASTLFRLTRGPRHLAIDEVHNFVPQGKVLDPDAGKMLHWGNRLASEGAGKGITLISASQRPQKVHKDYVTSHETLIAMRVIHPLDRGAVKDWVDGCPDPAVGREVMTTLASMDRGEGWAWCPEIGFGPVRVKFPLFKTYDSFAAPTTESTDRLKGWAEVDLDDVRAQLADAVEEAKANDPRELRAQVAELRRQLAESEKAGEPAWPDQREAVARLHDEARASRATVDALSGTIRAAAADAERLMRTLGAPLPEKVAPPPPAATPVPPPPPPPMRDLAEGSAVSVPVPPPPRLDVVDGASVTPAQQRMLDKIAWAAVFFRTPAVERQVLAFLLGKHPRTKSVLNDLGALRSAGHIEYLGSSVELTDSGRTLAADPGVPRYEELIAGVKSVLTPRQCEILDFVMARPTSATRDDLAAQLGLHVRTKSLLNDLGRLRTLGLVIYAGSGLRLAEFLEAR